MGEESRSTDFRRLAAGGGDVGCNGVVPVDDGYQDRVIEWDHGLPDCGDLTPLSQALVPLELASAFSIKPEPSRTVGDVALASRSTLSNLRGAAGAGASSQAFSTTDRHSSGALDGEEEYGRDEEGEDDEEAEDLILDDEGEGGGKKQLRKGDSAEEADSAMDGSKAAKRQRLVWTPQLHKRFVDVVSHLGIKNAVPKTIMQLMNVEGLTRENVASHLQKYRLYLKRMQGGSGGGSVTGNSDGGGSGGVGMGASSATDQLFASTPVPPHGANNENGGGVGVGSGAHASSHRQNGTYGSYGNGDMGNGHMPMPMPMMMGYGMPGGMVGMPVYGMYGAGHPGMPMDGNHHHRYGAMVPHPPQSGNASNDK